MKGNNMTLAFPIGGSVDSGGTVYIADTDHNRVRIIPASGPTLTLNSTSYCTGATWNVAIENALTDKPILLIGVSNGASWEVPFWGRTTNTGTFLEAGTFVAGNEGAHTIRVRIGDTLSNTASFTISRCAS
jgi:hypothetical protein